MISQELVWVDVVNAHLRKPRTFANFIRHLHLSFPSLVFVVPLVLLLFDSKLLQNISTLSLSARSQTLSSWNEITTLRFRPQKECMELENRFLRFLFPRIIHKLNFWCVIASSWQLPSPLWTNWTMQLCLSLYLLTTTSSFLVILLLAGSFLVLLCFWAPSWGFKDCEALDLECYKLHMH